MPTFALLLADDVRVERWLHRVDEKLQATDFLLRPLRGRVRSLKGGLYVLDVEPVYPRLLVNVMMLGLAAGSFMAYMTGFFGTAQVLFFVSLGVVLLWNLFWQPVFYQAVVFFMARKVTGGWCRVRRADRLALRKVAYGEV